MAKLDVVVAATVPAAAAADGGEDGNDDLDSHAVAAAAAFAAATCRSASSSLRFFSCCCCCSSRWAAASYSSASSLCSCSTTVIASSAIRFHLALSGACCFSDAALCLQIVNAYRCTSVLYLTYAACGARGWVAGRFGSNEHPPQARRRSRFQGCPLRFSPESFSRLSFPFLLSLAALGLSLHRTARLPA